MRGYKNILFPVLAKVILPQPKVFKMATPSLVTLGIKSGRKNVTKMPSL